MVYLNQSLATSTPWRHAISIISAIREHITCVIVKSGYFTCTCSFAHACARRKALKHKSPAFIDSANSSSDGPNK